MKRIVGIIAVFLVVFAAMTVLVSCKEEPVYKDYKVTVVDGAGVPMSNVIVKFTGEDGEAKSRVTGKDGVAELKNVLAGNYVVNLERGLSSAIIEVGEFNLTKDVTELYISVRDENNSMEIYGEVPDNSYATSIGVGSYDIRCSAGQSSYFILSARSSGIYRISLTSNDDGITVGYYGVPLFVQSTHRGEGEYDGKTFDIVIQDHSTPYVLGINATANATAHLTIERIGDAPFDPVFAEWTTVEATANLSKCNTAGKTLVDIDISDSTLSVSLGDDGYYYTSDGKLVYIRITSITGHGKMDESLNFVPALNGSLALLAGYVDDKVGINIGGYVYDGDGNFVEKRLYNSMIKTYMEYVDGTYGVVPLTEELAECIKLHGQSNGWWNPESSGYLFDGLLINEENAWLFLCMVEK